MLCNNCGGNLIEITGNLSFDDDIIGRYEITNAHYSKCEQCGEKLLPEATWEKADLEEAKTLEKMITSLPVSEFISATEAAKNLGISRQAIHKHNRIRKGFIYSIKLGGKLFYHRKSTLLFKETGDGRFPLVKKTKQEPKYSIYHRISALPYLEDFNHFFDNIKTLDKSTYGNEIHVRDGADYGCN